MTGVHKGYPYCPFKHECPSAEFHDESFGNKIKLFLTDPDILLLKILIFTFVS
jgi:hypothetical protein